MDQLQISMRIESYNDIMQNEIDVKKTTKKVH